MFTDILFLLPNHNLNLTGHTVLTLAWAPTDHLSSIPSPELCPGNTTPFPALPSASDYLGPPTFKESSHYRQVVANGK